MEYSKKVLNDVRKSIVNKIYVYSDGYRVLPNERIKIDKEILESLLFYKSHNSNGEEFKLPIWTGAFLKYIDLSEVSFDKVWWAGFHNPNFNCPIEPKDEKELEELKRVCKEHKGEVIDLSGTNAKIDFSKCQFQEDNRPVIKRCNFAGVDLSNNNTFLSVCNEIFFYKCNLRDTNLSFKPSYRTNFYFCNLENNNLIDAEVDLFDLLSEDIFPECNLKNTGLSLKLDSENMDYIRKHDKLKEKLRALIRNESIAGCFFNGVRKIHSSEEKEEIREQMKRKYQNFSHVLKDVDEQLQRVFKPID